MENQRQSYTAETLAATMKRYWGYDSFRELQLDIMLSAVNGRDTLALMPTGGGKSICFQVPGLVLGGTTIVVTPLVSLMKDQVDNLKTRHIKAVYLHSGMTSREIRVAWEHIFNGNCRFLYISPERLQNQNFCTELSHLDIRLIVVDEAHCISQWGYDFRPSYLGIAKLRKIVPQANVLALTATATPAVASDICSKLEFRTPNILSKSFSRDNISYLVRFTEDLEGYLLRVLCNTRGSAIVYVRSRRRTRQVAKYLTTMGIDATNFHAGLTFEEKEERQNRWKRGAVRVMVATNAFGMGIDKPDVRVVVHYGSPPSLEEYYQEAGRAGRDGKPSFAVLLTNNRDISRLKRNVEEQFPPKDDIKKVYERVCNFLKISLGEGYMKMKAFNLELFCQTFGYRERTVKAALRILDNSGYLTYNEEGELRSRIMIIPDRHELYDIPTSPDAARMLNALLRTYPGLFTDYIYISELELSKRLGIDTALVKELLIELSRAHVIHYIPFNNMPHILFDTSREEARNILIARFAYEERKATVAERTKAMTDYLTLKSGCRVSSMLGYFGETDAEACGKCDVCREKRKRSVSIAGRSRMADAVYDFIKTTPVPPTMGAVSERFGHGDSVREALRWLCAEGYIALRDGIYYPKQASGVKL